jgi:hypothetical protein
MGRFPEVIGRAREWLALATCVVVVAGCAPMQDGQKLDARREQIVYPSPPDEPRFVYERTIYGSADVLAKNLDGGLKRMLTGESERSEGLSKPYAIAVHRGRIFVSDSADRFVKVFDIPEGRYFKIGDDEQGPLAKPLGIDVDAAGNLYVADATHRAVMVYTRDGKYLRKIGGPKMFERLSSVTVEPNGQKVLVVDIGGVSSDMHRVRVFDGVTGTHLYDIGKRGIGAGEFNLPRDAAIGKNGQITLLMAGTSASRSLIGAASTCRALAPWASSLAILRGPRK